MSDEKIFNIDRFLPNWARIFGKEDKDGKGVPFIRIPPSAYAEAFDSLIQTLIENGYCRNRLENATMLNKLYETMTPRWASKKIIDPMKTRIERAWMHCIHNHYYDPSEVKAGKKIEVAKGEDQPVIIDRPLVSDEMGDPTPTESVIDESFDIFSGAGEDNG